MAYEMLLYRDICMSIMWKGIFPPTCSNKSPIRIASRQNVITPISAVLAWNPRRLFWKLQLYIIMAAITANVADTTTIPSPPTIGGSRIANAHPIEDPSKLTE